MRRWLSRRRFFGVLAGGLAAAAAKPSGAEASHCYWERSAGPYCSLDGRAYGYYCYKCCYSSGCYANWCGWFDLGACG